MKKEQVNKIAIHPLQTWQWGEFRKAWGNEIIHTKYGLLTAHRLPALPAGRPTTAYKIGMFIKGPKPTKQMLADLIKIGKENNLIFIKLEPAYVPPNGTSARFAESRRARQAQFNLLKNSGCVTGKTLFTPTTFIIDLAKSEEELLKNFSSKTRYNIRLAQRKGVKIKVDDSKKAFEVYLKLMRQTVERQGFYAHNERYHRLMWRYLRSQSMVDGQSSIAHLLTATYKKEIITTWILFVWKDTLYYPYGASSEKHKNVMANNLIMWEAIRFGKKLGLKKFDLWGREEGKGFTRFKEGYNPKVVEFLGTWDLVINKPLYFLYRSAEALRWPLLRLKSKLTKPKF